MKTALKSLLACLITITAQAAPYTGVLGYLERIAIGGTKNRHQPDMCDYSRKNTEHALTRADCSRVSKTEKRKSR